MAEDNRSRLKLKALEATGILIIFQRLVGRYHCILCRRAYTKLWFNVFAIKGFSFAFILFS